MSIEKLSKNGKKHALLNCNGCGKEMVGYVGDDICMECAYPLFAKASRAALTAVEENHFKRTGEKKSGNELIRNLLDKQ